MPRQLTVLYFAQARDASGTSRESVSLEQTMKVKDLLELLMESHPRLLPLRGTLRVAVDQELAGEEEELSGGEELAILPPVAGG